MKVVCESWVWCDHSEDVQDKTPGMTAFAAKQCGKPAVAVIVSTAPDAVGAFICEEHLSSGWQALTIQVADGDRRIVYGKPEELIAEKTAIVLRNGAGQ